MRIDLFDEYERAYLHGQRVPYQEWLESEVLEARATTEMLKYSLQTPCTAINDLNDGGKWLIRPSTGST